jgi:hypothetical protein
MRLRDFYKQIALALFVMLLMLFLYWFYFVSYTNQLNKKAVSESTPIALAHQTQLKNEMMSLRNDFVRKEDSLDSVTRYIDVIEVKENVDFPKDDVLFLRGGILEKEEDIKKKNVDTNKVYCYMYDEAKNTVGRFDIVTYYKTLFDADSHFLIFEPESGVILYSTINLNDGSNKSNEGAYLFQFLRLNNEEKDVDVLKNATLEMSHSIPISSAV